MSNIQDPRYGQSAGPIGTNQNLNDTINVQNEEIEVAQLLKKRREYTNFYVEQLYKATWIQRPGDKYPLRTGRRKNKNEVLGLILARLLKEKHISGLNISYINQLLHGIKTNFSNGEFILVLRTDGRIITMSDEAEYHLGKSMRSLYAQCINMYECLNRTDGEKLRLILSRSMDFKQEDHRLVCTLRLPKGKRPSRDNEDVKSITMTGHFFQSGDASSNEKLFVARCEALVSPSTKPTNTSQTLTASKFDTPKLMLNLVLNEDMSIDTVSSNVSDVLGYTKTEMVDNWLGRYVATDDLHKLEALQKQFFQYEQEKQKEQQKQSQKQKAIPLSVCEIFDMYTNNGEGRLTFLFQIRSRRQRRSKPIQFVIVAQLIDPAQRHEYVQYVQHDPSTTSESNNAEQVNLVSSSSVCQTIKDTILANSPTFTMGIPTIENGQYNGVMQQQNYSPFHRSLSKVVEPVDIIDQSWQELFDFDSIECPTATDFSCWSSNSLIEDPITCQNQQELDSIFDDYINGYYTNDHFY